MAIIRSIGGKLAKHLFLAKHLDRSAKSVVEADKAIFLKQKRLTVESAVEHFKTRSQFVRVMSPLTDYQDDAVAWEFVQGVLARFDEIEKEKSDGFDWVYRELRATA